MPLVALSAISTGPSAVLNGTASIPATAIPTNATWISIQMNVAQHLAGNANSLTISIDISLDSGATFNFFASTGRSSGSALGVGLNVNSVFGANWAGLALPIPPQALPAVQAGTAMVRGTIVTSGPTSTALQIVPFSGSP
jgi:hypothetical protein